MNWLSNTERFWHQAEFRESSVTLSDSLIQQADEKMPVDYLFFNVVLCHRNALLFYSRTGDSCTASIEGMGVRGGFEVALHLQRWFGFFTQGFAWLETNALIVGE